MAMLEEKCTATLQRIREGLNFVGSGDKIVYDVYGSIFNFLEQSSAEKILFIYSRRINS